MQRLGVSSAEADEGPHAPRDVHASREQSRVTRLQAEPGHRQGGAGP